MSLRWLSRSIRNMFVSWNQILFLEPENLCNILHLNNDKYELMIVFDSKSMKDGFCAFSGLLKICSVCLCHQKVILSWTFPFLSTITLFQELTVSVLAFTFGLLSLSDIDLAWEDELLPVMFCWSSEIFGANRLLATCSRCPLSRSLDPC